MHEHLSCRRSLLRFFSSWKVALINFVVQLTAVLYSLFLNILPKGGRESGISAAVIVWLYIVTVLPTAVCITAISSRYVSRRKTNGLIELQTWIFLYADVALWLVTLILAAVQKKHCDYGTILIFQCGSNPFFAPSHLNQKEISDGLAILSMSARFAIFLYVQRALATTSCRLERVDEKQDELIRKAIIMRELAPNDRASISNRLSEASRWTRNSDNGAVSSRQFEEFVNQKDKKAAQSAEDASLDDLILKILKKHSGSEDKVFSQMDVMRISCFHLSHTPIMNVLCFLFTLILAACEPAIAQSIKMIMDAAFDLSKASESPAEKNARQHRLVIALLFYGSVQIAKGFANILSGDLSKRIVEVNVMRIQKRMFIKLMHMNTNFYHMNSPASISTIYNSDVMELSTLWLGFFDQMLRSGLVLVASILYLFSQASLLAVGFVALIPLMLFYLPNDETGKASVRFSQQKRTVGGEFNDLLSIQQVVRVHQAASFVQNRFNVDIEHTTALWRLKNFWTNLLLILPQFYMQFGLMILMALLGIMGFRGGITASQFTAIYSLIQGCEAPITRIARYLGSSMNTSGSLQLIDDIMKSPEVECNDGPHKMSDTEFKHFEEVVFQAQRDDNMKTPSTASAVQITKSDAPLLKLEQTMEMKNVYFNYGYSFSEDEAVDENPLASSKEIHNDWTLRNINLRFTRGDYICIMGHSGCGKSTLLSLLMRFQPCSKGGILWDGCSVGYERETLRDFKKSVGVLFQRPLLLNATVHDNIAFGQIDLSRSDVIEAAKSAEIHEKIMTLPQGYDTVIGNRIFSGEDDAGFSMSAMAKNALSKRPDAYANEGAESKASAPAILSGGQMQRICLARAVARKPPLLLLDEATSALDPETEAAVVKTFEALARDNRMLIVSVTHRPNTAQNATQIVVLHNGEVSERGKYDELSKVEGSLFQSFLKAASS